MSRQETRGCKPSAGRISPCTWGIGLFSLTQLGRDNTDNKFEELGENGEQLSIFKETKETWIRFQILNIS